MNTYEISYNEFVKINGVTEIVRHVIGTAQAKNGIEAIKIALRAKGVDQADIDTGRSIGSNKRLVVYGITFEANKKTEA